MARVVWLDSCVSGPKQLPADPDSWPTFKCKLIHNPHSFESRWVLHESFITLCSYKKTGYIAYPGTSGPAGAARATCNWLPPDTAPARMGPLHLLHCQKMVSRRSREERRWFRREVNYNFPFHLHDRVKGYSGGKRHANTDKGTDFRSFGDKVGKAASLDMISKLMGAKLPSKIERTKLKILLVESDIEPIGSACVSIVCMRHLFQLSPVRLKKRDIYT